MVLRQRFCSYTMANKRIDQYDTVTPDGDEWLLIQDPVSLAYNKTAVSSVGGSGSGEMNVQSDWNQADNTADDYIKNKPTIPTVTGTNTGDETTATIKTKLGITTLSGSNTGDQDLSGYATTSALTTGLAGKAATSHTHVKADVGLGNVDNTADLSKPISTATQTALDGKQATLVSGTNIKTINGTSVLGSGNITIAGGGAVDSVNAQTGVVVLDADDISDAATTNKFVTAADKTKLSNLSGTNTGDQDLSGYSTTSHTHTLDNLSDVAITSPSTGQVLKYNGSGWVNDTDATAGGAGATNLSTTLSSTQTIIVSDTGTDATIPAVDGTNAGVMTPTQKTKLDGIATSATANSSDATLLARANHTGTQSADTITDGTTNKAYTATEKTKLAGIATGATANTGDIVGPASSVDNSIPRFNGTGGKTVQGSNVVVTDDYDIEIYDAGTGMRLRGGTLPEIRTNSGTTLDIIGNWGVRIDTGAGTDTGVTVAGVLIQDGLVDGKDVSTLASASHTHAVTDLTATGTPSSSTFLRGDNTWSVPAGAGDVAGPASSTNNNVAMFDGTTGKLLKDSGITLAGSNTGDETTATIKTKLGITTLSGSNTGDQTTVTGSAGSLKSPSTTGVGQLTGMAAGTTRVYTVPNANATLLTSAAAVTVAQGGTGATTLTGILKGNGTSAVTAVTAPSGAIVGTTDTQTLSGKTLTTPLIDTINEQTAANGVTVDGLNIKDGKLNTDDSVVTSNITNGAVTLPKFHSGATSGVLLANGTGGTTAVKGLNYSTTETWTGGTWIDGSLIYRKTITFGSLPNTTTKSVAHSISGLSYVVSLTAVATNGSGAFLPLPYAHSSQIGLNIVMYVSGANVAVETKSDRTAYTTCYITIQYTKSA